MIIPRKFPDAQTLEERTSALLAHRGLRIACAVLAVLLMVPVLIAPLDLENQVMFAVLGMAAVLVLRKVASRLAILAMITFSLIASCRYMYWRLTSTLGFETWLDAGFGYGLLMAELYAFVVLLFGYVQTAWPLQRKPVPLPADRSLWPTVDVFIPTYNESLDIVRFTALSALAMDWPRDKFRVYVLDDGRREEFRDFCAESGIGYLTRSDNKHAKAGNINAALAQTDGEFITIFDCDHIPTRSFLQVTMGWFLKDPKLALLQTPHHFFSPDPFEKNLNTFRDVPNEGELFYGLVQDGNDLWNATFFCGSCAVARRAPLLEVGGVAVETVTEDAHTALKMSRRGYNTAYLAIPQAAGLATDSLSAHIGQRIRWARGMAQIFRIDNPLLGKGLKLGQRICYANAMLHFFYGLPRLVFLTAPLAYVVFGAQVFNASAAMIAAYALPHILYASVTNSAIQGRFRHSFWNEVYETVLAWYIMRPTLLAVINPKLGKFNVTAKGGVIEKDYFDWKMALPYILILVINLTVTAYGIGKLILVSEGVTAGTLLINLTWTLYNIVICSAAVAVASEARQLRSEPRVRAEIRAMLSLPDGKTIACRTTDFSQHGLGILLPEGATVPRDTPVDVSLFFEEHESVFPGAVRFSRNRQLGISFGEISIGQQFELAKMTFSRADNWTREWGHSRRDLPSVALRDVSKIGVRGFCQLALATAGETRSRAATLFKNRAHLLSPRKLLSRNP